MIRLTTLYWKLTTSQARLMHFIWLPHVTPNNPVRNNTHECEILLNAGHCAKHQTGWPHLTSNSRSNYYCYCYYHLLSQEPLYTPTEIISFDPPRRPIALNKGGSESLRHLPKGTQLICPRSGMNSKSIGLWGLDSSPPCYLSSMPKN